MRQLFLAALTIGVLANAPAPAAASPSVGSTTPSTASADTLQHLEQAARTAWSFVERNYQEETGLVKTLDTYGNLTTWDIGSVLGAYVSAHRLGLIDQAEYDRKMSRALQTLQEMRLYDGAAFNKLYDASTGEAIDRAQRPSQRGFGWSALDLGRLLVWLKIVEQTDPAHAEAARQVAERLDWDRLVTEEGYLRGEDLDPDTDEPRRYPEGRIGYEQYAAAGFELWGARADSALDLEANTEPAEVLGVQVLRDRRGSDKLTSEPFLMMGLELGWDEQWQRIAESLLAAQEARYRQTGRITMVSEDAMPEEPHYFYYSTILHEGEPFAIYAQGREGTLDAPRWISTKATFGWHVLLPSEYTAEAMRAVAAAERPGHGWSSGVYEQSHRPTGMANINTAAMVLEAALFANTGRPAIELPPLE